MYNVHVKCTDFDVPVNFVNSEKAVGSVGAVQEPCHTTKRVGWPHRRHKTDFNEIY